MNNEYLRKSDIKREYHVSYTTIEKWIKQGLLSNGLNGVLFTRKEIDAIVNRPRKKPGRKPVNNGYKGMKIKGDKIVEISESDLYKMYLEREMYNVCDFKDYMTAFEEQGCNVIKEQ